MGTKLKTWAIPLALALLIGALAPRLASASPEWKSVDLGTVSHGTAAAETATFSNLSQYERVFVTVSATADTLNVSYSVSYDGGTTWSLFQSVAASNIFTGSGTASAKSKTVQLDEVGVTAGEGNGGVPIPMLKVTVIADPTAGAASNGDGDNATLVQVHVAGIRKP